MVAKIIKLLLYHERDSILRSSANMIVISFGLGVMRLSALIVSIIIARHSDPTTFGAFTLFTTIFFLASEIPKALDGSYIRFANDPASKAPPDVFHVSALISKIALIVPTIILAIIVTYFVSQEGELPELMQFALISGSLFCIYSTFVAGYQQRKQFAYFSLFKPLPYMLVLIGFGLLLLKNDVIDITNVQWIYMLVGISVGLGAILAIISKTQIDLHAIQSNYLYYMKNASILLITSLITNVSGRLDVFILTKYVSFSQLAEYGIGLRLALLISFISGVVSILLYPKAPEVQSDRGRFNRYLGLSALYALPQTLITITLIILIDPIISLLFGQTYLTDVSRVVSILLICNMLVTSYAIPFQALIQFGKHPKNIMYISLLRSIVTIAALLIFVPSKGVMGAAFVLLFISLIFLLIAVVVAMTTCRPQYTCSPLRG